MTYKIGTSHMCRRCHGPVIAKEADAAVGHLRALLRDLRPLTDEGDGVFSRHDLNELRRRIDAEIGATVQSIVTTQTSDAEREIARMIQDHASIIANKGKACVFCGAIGGEHHLSTCRADGDKSDGATATVTASEAAK